MIMTVPKIQLSVFLLQVAIHAETVTKIHASDTSVSGQNWWFSRSGI